ncbi:Hypothetical protein EfmE4452_0330 [Enterococcus faecium E4452]|nr:hypothetical protein EfmU0317_0347 [Enterococcus faecium U0317]EHM36333.1 Hypothetical protein EfmE4452_0330 [Enterococcus faecium E4452]MBK4868002.1 hypothetical protein [Enterococcus faecium]
MNGEEYSSFTSFYAEKANLLKRNKCYLNMDIDLLLLF